MKAMQKVFLLFMSTLFSYRSIAQKVALISDGHQPVLVANEKILLAEWNEILQSRSGINCHLQNVSIIQIANIYYLRAKGNNGYTSTLLLQTETIKKGTLSDIYLIAINVSCTSKDCGNDYGCIPTPDRICTPGCDIDNCIQTINIPKPLNVDKTNCIYFFSCDANHFL